MDFHQLPKQPPIIVSYLRVGKLLYISMFLFIVESILFGWLFKNSYQYGQVWATVFWGVAFLFSFIHIFLVLADGWSRFQDYKMVKDLFFEYGFQPRVARMYIGSKCQRTAALVAASELGIREEVESYYKSKGVKWHHFIPYFMVQDPMFLFRRRFWSRTFLKKQYTPRYQYRMAKRLLNA